MQENLYVDELGRRKEMKRRSLMVLAAMFSLFMLMIPVHAMTPVEPDRTCTVKIEKYPGEGAVFRFYKIADTDDIMRFTLTDKFKPYEETVIVNNIEDQETWVELADTLSAYVNGDQIPSDYEGTIKDGTCSLEVKTGLYLVLSDPVIVERSESDPADVAKKRYWTTPIIITAPNAFVPEGGSRNTADIEKWEYEFSIVPKYKSEAITYEDVQYKVVKQWKDGKGEKRPPSITVNILKNGKVNKTVVLNKDNDWCYTWTAKDDGSQWQVQETSIPAGYKVRNSSNQTTFTICNYTEQPNTSDTPVSKTPMITLCIFGMIALVCGYILLRNRKEAEQE